MYYDIYSRLLKDRIIFLGTGVIDDEVANSHRRPDPVSCNRTTPRRTSTSTSIRRVASVSAGLAIYDTMQFVTCDVATYCIGQAASMGAVLLTARAPKDKRFALPNARIMIHQPLAGMQGTAEDIEIHATEFLKVKQRLNNILLKHTGQDLKKIEADTDRDRFMSADEAVEYRLIDKVVAHMNEA